MLFSMPLNKIKRLYQRYNNVKINKNETAGQYVSRDKKKAILTMSTSSSCLYVNYWPWVNWPGHNIYLHRKFLPTDSEAKMVPLSNIMKFRNICTSVTSYLWKFLDMDQKVVILLFHLLHPLFPPSSFLARHKPFPVRWWKSYKLPPTKFLEFVSKPIAYVRRSHL